MKRNFNKLDNLEEPDKPVRTGVLKSALGAKEGRKDKWTKEAYKELEEAEKKEEGEIEHSSENWIMRIMNRRKMITLMEKE